MRMTWKQMLAEAAPVVALVACIAWVHAPTLLGNAHLTAHHDNLDGAAPLRVEAARQWRSGHVPLWNPWKRTGMPLLADTTAGAVYPGNFPFVFVSSSPSGSTDSPVFRAMDQVAALHALLAGLFMYAFLRVIALGAPASLLGALVYACSGTMGWFAAWYIQIQNSVVWLPLVLVALHKAANGSPRLPAWIALGGVAVALQFFAGFPETSFYSALIAIGYALSLTRRDRWWQPLVAVAAIYVAGLLLAAVQLFPSLELQALSRRPGALTLEMFQSLPASVSMVRGWVLPSPPAALEFPPLAAYHFGGAAVLAAVLGLFGLSRTVVFFACVLTVAFVLSLGGATPFSAWAHHLPVVSSFRHPFKHLFELSFAMAGLAALGAERLVRWRAGARWPLAIVAVAVGLTCATLRTNQGVLIAANPALVDTSGLRPAIAARMEPGWRVLTPRDFFQKRDPAFLLGDYPTQFGIPAVHGAGPFLWKPLADATGMVEEETTFRRGLFDSRDRTLALLSCRYLVQRRQDGKFVPPVDPGAWRTVAESGEARLVEDAGALPRIRFVDVVRCSDPQTVETTLRGGAADPRDVALVDCSQGDRPAGGFTAGASLAATVVEERPGHLELAVDVPVDGRGFLVVSQADYPGWQARADGESIPLRRVHGLVQGLEVPGGTSRLELAFWPFSFVAGATTSGVTLLALLLLNLVGLRRVRPGSAAPSP